MALTSDGTMWTWGANLWNQLGTYSPESVITPVPVKSLPSVADIGAGYGVGYAVDTDGYAYSWGLNYYWQLGFPTPESTILPVHTKDVGVLLVVN